MKSALLISFSFHIVVGVLWMYLVRISHVRFVPRDVITVNLVRLEEPKPAKKPLPTVRDEPEPPDPQAVPPEPEPEPEWTPPPEVKRKPPKKKEVKKADPPKPQPEPEVVPKAEAEEETEAVTTGDMSLDQEDFPFAYYLVNMKRKVAALWRVPQSQAPENTYCIIYFRVLRNGTIQSATIEQSSGNVLFDQAAQRAVVRANPLPPLPDGFGDDYLGVHYTFAYEPE